MSAAEDFRRGILRETSREAARAARFSTRCECGNPKRPGRRACPRCEALDGDGKQDGVLIAAMRDLSGVATLDALVTETGWSPRQVRRALERLKASGRIRRIETHEGNHYNEPTFVLVERSRR